MDCIVHAVAKSRTQLSKFHFHFHPSFTDEETEGGLERKISDSPPPKAIQLNQDSRPYVFEPIPPFPRLQLGPWVQDTHMHDVCALVENLHIRLQNLKVEGGRQQATVAAPLVTSTQQEPIP